MALPEIDKAFRTYHRFSNVVSGNPWSITLDFVLEAGNEDGDAEDLADMLLGAWTSIYAFDLTSTGTYAQRQHEDVKLEEIVVYDLSGNGAGLVVPGLSNHKGVSNADPMPPDNAIVVSKRTGLRGRAHRGRAYVGGWTVDYVDAAGQVFGRQVGVAFDTHMKQVGISPSQLYNMVVISQAAVPTGTAQLVTSLSSDVHWDTQRRRGR